MGLRGRRHQNARIASLLAGRGLRPIRGLPYVIWKQRCARSHRLPQRVKGATAQSPPPPFLCPRGSPQTRAGRVASPPPASSSRDVPLPTFPRGRALVCSGYPKPQDQPLQGGLRPVFSHNGPRYRAPQSKNQPGSETRERLPHGRGRSGERKELALARLLPLSVKGRVHPPFRFRPYSRPVLSYSATLYLLIYSEKTQSNRSLTSGVGFKL